MVIRTYFDKNNTILSNNNINTGRNPVTELFYGGDVGNTKYSRFIFHFNENKIKALYNSGVFTDLSKLKHTLRMVNTGSFNDRNLNGTMGNKNRTSSFDLVVFKIEQEWDEGVGYDYEIGTPIVGNNSVSIAPSNWVNPRTGEDWDNGAGIYPNDPSSITVGIQHFDKGNENIEIDITDYVNSILTGETNHGLGIAYQRGFELTPTTNLQYVGFFTRHTQTFYEPHIETVYNNIIEDDRNRFFLGKNNKLYLYVNINGIPTNLDTKPTVIVRDNEDNIFSSFTEDDVTHITKGVYMINILVPDSEIYSECVNFYDTWYGIMVNGVERPPTELTFSLKGSEEYYQIGSDDGLPKRVGLSVSGIRDGEKIKRGDTRKVIISTRKPYTINQTEYVDSIKYRIYVKEGDSEFTIIDFMDVNVANNNYFILDSESLLPGIYYLDVITTSNLEVTTTKGVIKFEIVNQVESRKSQ